MNSLSHTLLKRSIAYTAAALWPPQTRFLSQTPAFVVTSANLLRLSVDFELSLSSLTQGSEARESTELDRSESIITSEIDYTMGKSKNGFYAVQKGRQTGVFTSWSTCETQVKGFSGAVYKSFPTRGQAEAFARASSGSGWSNAVPALDAPSGSDYKKAREAHNNKKQQSEPGSKKDFAPKSITKLEQGLESALMREKKLEQALMRARAALHDSTIQPASDSKSIFSTTSGQDIIAFCDGSSIGNGTRGARAGWGVYFENTNMRHLNESRRLPGFLQTNNRAELMALIRAIRLCYQDPSNAGRQLVLMTDSQYSMDCVTKWIPNWRQRKWKTSTGSDVLNRDLVQMLDEELHKYLPRPKLVKVKAHSGIEGNEIVDRMAKFGASLPESDSLDLNVRSTAPEDHTIHTDLVDLKTSETIHLTDD